MKHWKDIVGISIPITEALHKRWSIGDHLGEWKPVQKALWMGWGIPQARLIAWCVLHHSYYSNGCGAIQGDTGHLSRVQSAKRNHSTHFFECNATSRRWSVVNAIVAYSPLQSIVQDLFSMLQKAFWRQIHYLAQLILVTIFLHITWVERNQMARKGDYFRFPLEHVLKFALMQMEVLKDGVHLTRNIGILNRSYEALCDSLDHYHEHNNQWGW